MDWKTFEDETMNLARMIDYAPDMVVGIARGGVIPAALLSKSLGVKDMFTLKLERENDRRISADALPDISGKKILLVEDMLETGRGLKNGKKFLEERGARVMTACLYTMPISETTPDFFLRQVGEVVDFPWNHLPPLAG